MNTRLKSFSDFSILNEAKQFPVGSTILVKANEDMSERIRRDWSNYNPDQEKGTEGGFFLFNVEVSGSQWLQGKILVPNCCRDADILTNYRVRKHYCEASGIIKSIFENSKFTELYKQKFLVYGDESFLMNSKGEKTTTEEGEYTLYGMNFKVSEETNSPCMYLTGSHGKYICVFEEDLNSLGKEITEDQNEVIADFLQKKFKDYKIRYDKEYKKFKISSFWVKAKNIRGANMTVSCHFSKKDAEKAIESILKDEITFYDKSTFTIYDAGMLDFTFDQLKDMLKMNNQKISTKEIFQERRGHIATKGLGLV